MGNQEDKSRDRVENPVCVNTDESGKPLIRNYHWYVVGMLWLIAFFNYADRSAIPVMLPLLGKDLGLDKTQLGTLMSVFGAVYGLMAPVAGIIIDRVRRKTAILVGLCVWSAVCMCIAASKGLWTLRTLIALEGMGETFYFPASMSLVSDYHTKRTRSRAMSLHQTSVYIGTIAGAFFAGLIGLRYGWKMSFIVFGGLGIVLGVVLWKLLREPKRGAADLAEAGVVRTEPARRFTIAEAFRLILTTPTMWTLLLAFMCANFVFFALFSWLPTFVKEQYGWNLAVAGLAATAFPNLASMVSCPLSGLIGDALRARTPRGRMLVQMVGVLCGACFVALCGISRSPVTLMVSLTAWGFFKGLYDAHIFASAYDVIPEEARGTVAGVMNAFAWLGGAGTAPIVVGAIAKHAGLGVGIALASSVYVLSGALLLIGILFFVKRDAARLQAYVARARV